MALCIVCVHTYVSYLSKVVITLDCVCMYLCIHSYFIHIILMCAKVLGSYFSKLEWNSVVMKLAISGHKLVYLVI